MALIDRLAGSLDPLHGMADSTRQEFARWYLRARLPQIRYVAFLTMLMYFVYAAVEQSVAQDNLGLRLLVHGLLVPLALFCSGLMSYSETRHEQMLVLLSMAPAGAVVANLAFNHGNPDFAYFVPEVYLALMWTFTVSGLTLRQALWTAGVSSLALLAAPLGEPPQTGPQRLHLTWILSALSFGFLCAFVLEKAYKTMFLHQRQLALSASLDGLTGLWNRTCITQMLAEEIARAQRYGTPFSVILIDIDHFKSVNDQHGHAVGDSVLRQFATLLRDNVRSCDKVGRLGGEEFVVILPEIEAGRAEVAARTLQQRIREFSFDTVQRKTASFGVTQFQRGEALQSMLDRADRALYRAKAAGRDRVEAL